MKVVKKPSKGNNMEITVLEVLGLYKLYVEALSISHDLLLRNPPVQPEEVANRLLTTVIPPLDAVPKGSTLLKELAPALGKIVAKDCGLTNIPISLFFKHYNEIVLEYSRIRHKTYVKRVRISRGD